MLDRFGIWAIAPERLQPLLSGNAFERIGERQKLADGTAIGETRLATWALDGGRGGGARYALDRGVAVIGLDGVLTKGGSWYGSSTDEVRMQLLAAAQDEQVHAIALRVSSPGGEMAGIDELAQAYAAAGERKPTRTFYEDLGASAALFVGSQGQKSYANRTAMLGSIGVYCVVCDYSDMAAQAGIKVHVVKSAEHKGAGVPGTQITDDMLAERQRFVDAGHDLFVRTVATGRGLSLAKTRELADGRSHTAPEAKTLGLIDDVRTFDSLLDELAAKKPKPQKTQTKGARAMSEETETVVNTPAAPRAATFQELKAELVGADAGFLVAQLEANASLDQARKAWMTELAGRAQANAQKAQRAEEAAEAAKHKPGVEALATGSAAAETEAGADAIVAFNALVEAELKAMGHRAEQTPASLVKPTARGKATVRAAEKHPDAHEAYLAAYNGRYRKAYGSRKPAPLKQAMAG